MHTVHAGLSIAAVIKPEKIEAVNAIFKQMNADPGNNARLPFAKSLTTHLVSGLVVPYQKVDDQVYPATLMLMTSYTGPYQVHLDELVRIGGSGLRDLFSACTDFPAAALTNDDALKSFITRHRRPDTFYTGMQYITHTDIANENKLRDNIENYIDSQQAAGSFNGLDAAAIRKSIQDHVRGNPDFAWTRTECKTSFADTWALWGGAIKAIIGLILIFVLGGLGLQYLLDISFWLDLLFILAGIIAIVIFLLVAYRINEKQKHFVAPRQPDADVHSVMCTQNHPVINEMTITGPLKHGWIHPVTFNFVLWIVSLVRGILTIPTIATARWLTIDGGKRMVFISNFGNLSESYVRDFIDSKASAWKINLLFGQGHGYPGTRWLINDGCFKDTDAFLNDVHLYQQKTQFWYWPYMDLSVDNININRQIRLGLFSNLTEKQATAWLQLF